MTPEYDEQLATVVKLHPEVLDPNGNIIASPVAFEKVRASNPEPTTDDEGAGLHRKAQVQTVLDLYERIRPSPRS